MSEEVVVVTGAAGGIGREIARCLAASGWQVIAVDRNAEGLTTLHAEFSAVTAVCGELADLYTVREARAAAERVGRLSAWVNNAAIIRLGALHTLPAADMDELLAVNLRAVIGGTQQAVQSFLQHGVTGSIVNLSSIHARSAFPGYAVYDTCKGGVEALTRYVCVEYGHLGIRCNAVAPGAVLTPAAIRLSEQTDDPDAAFEATHELSPMRRTSSPAEIADVVEFLLGPSATAINGHVLAVDNGMSARSNTFAPDPAIVFPRGAATI